MKVTLISTEDRLSGKPRLFALMTACNAADVAHIIELRSHISTPTIDEFDFGFRFQADGIYLILPLDEKLVRLLQPLPPPIPPIGLLKDTTGRHLDTRA